MMRLTKLAAACGVALLVALPGAQAQTPPNTAELVFTPIAPCRAFLTSTALAANEARTFRISGTADAFNTQDGTASEFRAQGGPSAGCGIPASAAAVAISLTSFGGAGTGHLRSAAFGDPITTTQVLSFHANATETASAIAALKSKKLTIKAYTAATKIAGDITGYFAPQIRAHVAENGTVISKTSRILSTLQDRTVGKYYIKIDRNVEECAISALTSNPNNGIFITSSEDTITINIHDPTSGGYRYYPFWIFALC